MSKLPTWDEKPEFELKTGALGDLPIRRVIVRDIIEVSKLLAITPGPSDSNLVRALFAAVLKHPDRTSMEPVDIPVLSDEELEGFAEGVVTAGSIGQRTDPERGSEEAAVSFVARSIKQFGKMVSPSTSGIETMRQMFPWASSIAGDARNSDLLRRASRINAPPIAKPIAAALLPSLPRPADTALKKLDERLVEFEATIDDQDKAEMIAVSAPGGSSFYIEEREAIGAEYLSLKGFDMQGKPVEVVQHYSQLNVALIAVPKVPPDRIGFL